MYHRLKLCTVMSLLPVVELVTAKAADTTLAGSLFQSLAVLGQKELVESVIIS